MKKLWHVLVFTLAINFVALAGAVGWLYQSKKLDREKIHAIKDIVFPATQPTTQPSTQPSDAEAATTQPSLRLEELLARHAGRSATDQVEYMQRSFDAQMAQLDRKQRELADLQRQVDLAKQQLASDRDTLASQRKEVDTAEAEVARLQTDKGFQDSLALYQSMPTKQVKAVFMTLQDETIIQYLQAMQPRTAARIVKEFKSPEEVARIQRVMEKMRQASASLSSATASAETSTVPATPEESRNAK